MVIEIANFLAGRMLMTKSLHDIRLTRFKSVEVQSGLKQSFDHVLAFSSWIRLAIIVIIFGRP
jgi:hypothetical protein